MLHRPTGLLPIAVVLLALASACPGVAQAQPFDLEAREEQAFKQAAALVAPSLVRIETVGGLERVEQILTGTGPTTGLVVSADGYIITSSFNFIAKPASILVTLSDGRRLAAAQVAIDKVKMLTLLKVEAADLPVPQMAPRDSFRVGQWSLALGKTLDEVPSVSVGIVSALNRIWGKAIQTDAKVSPVNYGGALADVQGRVLGVLVPLSPQASGEVAGVEWYDGGIGFAIPLVDVYATLERLKRGEDLFPGLMGITVKVEDIYEGQPVIDRVRYGSPAQAVGLKEKDAIVAIDGHAIRRHTQMKHVLGNKYAGEKLSVTVKRGDEEITRELTLVDKLVPYESAFLGVLPVRDAAGEAPLAGVGVRYVVPDSPADLAGVGRGERITKFNGHELAGPAALLDLVSRERVGAKATLEVAGASGAREVQVALAAIPEAVPLDLRPAAMRPREGELADKSLKVGHFTDKMPAHEHEYWAWIPEDYNPNYKYTLLVWLHPAGDTMEAAMVAAWKTICDERGIILLAPKAKQVAGWTPDESEFIKDAIEEFVAKYSIDRARVVLHAYGSSGPVAYNTAFKYRELIHGLSAVAAPLSAPPPDNEPDYRLQLHFVSGESDPVHRAVTATAKALREMKFPVVHTTIPKGGHKYPPAVTVEEIAEWIDALDRI